MSGLGVFSCVELHSHWDFNDPSVCHPEMPFNKTNVIGNVNFLVHKYSSGTNIPALQSIIRKVVTFSSSSSSMAIRWGKIKEEKYFLFLERLTVYFYLIVLQSTLKHSLFRLWETYGSLYFPVRGQHFILSVIHSPSSFSLSCHTIMLQSREWKLSWLLEN